MDLKLSLFASISSKVTSPRTTDSDHQKEEGVGGWEEFLKNFIRILIFTFHPHSL